MRSLKSPFKPDETGEVRIYNGKRYFSRNPQKFENVFAMEIMAEGVEQNPDGISIPRKVWNNCSKA